MKTIQKFFISFSLLLSVLAFTACASKEAISDAGKSGSIKVTIGSYLTVQAIDGQPTKFKTTMRLEPGEHVLDIRFYKFTLDYTKEGYIRKFFVFEEGKNYTLKAIEDMNSNGCYFPLREEGLQKFTGVKTTVKKLEDPESSDGQNIEVLSRLPQDRKFEVVGEYEYTISGGIFATKSLTEDRAILYFQEFLTQYDLDAIVDPWVANTFSGQTVNALGIRYLDE